MYRGLVSLKRRRSLSSLRPENLGPESRLKSHSFIGMEKAGRRKSHTCAIAYADLYLARDIRSRNISSFQPPGVQKQL